MKKNLIVGSGKRVTQSLIPALQLINEEIYISARNKNSVKKLISLYKVKEIETLSNLPFLFDKIFIAIPPENILEIIKLFSKLNIINTTLFIDTPIIGPNKNIEIIKYKKYFKDILVTEDWIEKPFFTISKEIIKKNNLGRIKKIEFYKSGFTYHALAIARQLLNKKRVIMVRRKQVSEINNLTSIYFYRSKITLLYPIDYQNCYTTIFCSKGVISDNVNCKKYKNLYLIEKKIYKNDIDNYFVNNKKYNFFLNDKIDFLLGLKLKKLDDLSIEKKEKILGLVTIFSQKNYNNYSIEEGIYDSMIFKLLDKYKIYINLFFLKQSLIFYFFKLIKRR